ncbi:MAG: alpha/beta fold hydrolase [Solirubrobacteraceae bacterium]|nr:alpha/beta fold hydrolase [Solirubrobacteraceae bacterium]
MLRTIVAAVTLTAALTITAEPAAADPLPVKYDFIDAILKGQARPNAAPPGTNDFSCRPSAEHPNPVVLVHGTAANMALSWRAIGPELKNRGFCVFALNYGRLYPGPSFGLARIERSARELGVFVDRVLAATGATKVDIIGHSQGGMMPRQYLRFEGGAGKVGTLVGMSPSNHGSGDPDEVDAPSRVPAWVRNWLRSLTSSLAPAFAQQSAGSPFMRQLNEGGDTVPGVRYVVIQTRYDEIVTPWTSALLDGPDVTNIVVQDGCEQNKIDHAAIVYDRRAVGYALRALDPSDTSPVPCTRPRPWVGG